MTADITFGNLGNFTGVVQLTDQDKNLSFSKKLNNGELIDSTSFDKNEASDLSVSYRVQQNCNTLTIPEYTEWYKVYIIDGEEYLEFSHIQYTGSHTVQVCGSGSGGLPEINENGYNSAGVYKKRNISGPAQDDGIILIETENEEQIDNQLTGKANCVYEKLIISAINNHNIITSTFLYFGDGNPFTNNLIYKEETNFFNNDGIILLGKFEKVGNNYIVTLNKDQYNNRSPIEIAATILHESVHALLKNHYYNGTESFIDLFGEYMRVKNGSNNITHAIMRDNYIPSIANALKQFDNNQENDSFYENLAWEGLHQFLSTEEKNNILEDIKKARDKGLNCN